MLDGKVILHQNKVFKSEIDFWETMEKDVSDIIDEETEAKEPLIQEAKGKYGYDNKQELEELIDLFH